MSPSPSAPRRIVVTGASSGLGRGLALSYAAPGASLGLVGRDPARLAETAGACRARGADVETARLDVAEPAPLREWLLAFDAGAPVDLVVANAGISGSVQDADSTEGLEAATRLVRTNLLGAIHTVEPLTAGMIARRSGQIALIASTAAYRGIPYMPAYGASKAGVRVYGEALRALLAPHGIAVTVATPSFFDSPMSDRFHGEKPLMLSTDAAAARIRRALDRRAPRVAFPRRVALLMQLLDLLPARVGDAMLRANRFRIEP
jgi:short-subunit dehydrogenase